MVSKQLLLIPVLAAASVGLLVWLAYNTPKEEGEPHAETGAPSGPVNIDQVARGILAGLLLFDSISAIIMYWFMPGWRPTTPWWKTLFKHPVYSRAVYNAVSLALLQALPDTNIVAAHDVGMRKLWGLLAVGGIAAVSEAIRDRRACGTTCPGLLVRWNRNLSPLDGRCCIHTGEKGNAMVIESLGSLRELIESSALGRRIKAVNALWRCTECGHCPVPMMIAEISEVPKVTTVEAHPRSYPLPEVPEEVPMSMPEEEPAPESKCILPDFSRLEQEQQQQSYHLVSRISTMARRRARFTASTADGVISMQPTLSARLRSACIECE